jgi:hypothetical protein
VEIYLFTQTNSYHAKLKRKHINRELTWNNELLGRLENVFSGRSTNILINLLDGKYDSKIFVASTQL